MALWYDIVFPGAGLCLAFIPDDVTCKIISCNFKPLWYAIIMKWYVVTLRDDMLWHYVMICYDIICPHSYFPGFGHLARRSWREDLPHAQESTIRSPHHAPLCLITAEGSHPETFLCPRRHPYTYSRKQLPLAPIKLVCRNTSTASPHTTLR